MNSPLVIGAIGTSSIMDYIQQGISRTDGLSCRIVFSRDSRRGADFAAAHGIAENTDNLESMLCRDDIDVIYIASPNRLHPEQAIAAMNHGKHVLVEKPAAVHAGDLLAMKEAADRNHVFFFECITTIFMPNFLEFQRLIPQIGKIQSAEFNYGQYSSRYDAYLRGENPNNFNPDMDGGALNDLGVYCVHAAVRLFGEPQKVSYLPLRGPNGVDIAGTLTMQYPDFVCTVRTAKDRPMDSSVILTGSSGVLSESGSLNSFPAARLDAGNTLREIQCQTPDDHRMLWEFARFRDAIQNGDRDFFESMFRQSLLTASILEQAHESAKN